MMTTSLALIILAVLTGFFTYFGSDSTYYEIRRNVRYLIVLLLVASAYLQWKKDKDSDLDQNEKFRRTMGRADSILGGIKVSYDSVKRIQGRLDRQQRLQAKLDSEALRLLAENKGIAEQQVGIYENVDRLMSPIFPMDLFLSVRYSGTYPGAERVRKFLQAARRLYDGKKNHMVIGGITFYRDVEQKEANGMYDTIYSASIDKPQTVFDKKTLWEYNSLIRFEAAFSGRLGQMRFMVDGDVATSDWIDFFYEYNDNSIHITAKYSNISFKAPDRGWGTTATMGFNDLAKGIFSIAPIGCDTAYNIDHVSFDSKTGLKKGYLFRFDKSNKIIDGGGCPVYSRRLRTSDLLENYDEGYPAIPPKYKSKTW